MAKWTQDPDGGWTSDEGKHIGKDEPVGNLDPADQKDFERDFNAKYAQGAGFQKNQQGEYGSTGFNWLTDEVQPFFFGNEQHQGMFGGNRTVQDPYAINPNAYDMPGYNAWQTMLAQKGKEAGSRNTINLNDAAQGRDIQMDLIQKLQAQARGEGPSIAQAQLQQATDQNVANTMALAASGRGAGAGGVAYNAQNQGAAARQKMAGDSGMLRLQEQMQAQNMLADVSGQMRGQDLSQQGLTLQQTAMNDELVKFYTQAGLSLEQARQQAQQALQEIRVKQQVEMEKLRNESYYGGKSAAEGAASGIGSLLSLLAL